MVLDLPEESRKKMGQIRRQVAFETRKRGILPGEACQCAAGVTPYLLRTFSGGGVIKTTLDMSRGRNIKCPSLCAYLPQMSYDNNFVYF